MPSSALAHLLIDLENKQLQAESICRRQSQIMAVLCWIAWAIAELGVERAVQGHWFYRVPCLSLMRLLKGCCKI
ncbi:unnamed protein product [Cylicocyclus nassatus]|uniref:Uncharacterized protein n=1 Tax=Cylicocyclus nassatus TaxID=53992 RepID=A0AA36DQZ3_CYLNA|nr:unnamed protein product [Cylicocyclus nassatus]